MRRLKNCTPRDSQALGQPSMISVSQIARTKNAFLSLETARAQKYLDIPSHFVDGGRSIMPSTGATQRSIQGLESHTICTCLEQYSLKPRVSGCDPPSVLQGVLRLPGWQVRFSDLQYFARDQRPKVTIIWRRSMYNIAYETRGSTDSPFITPESSLSRMFA
ncbi:hypothetical protein BJY00DRAFT_9444 [Aspergillus carlsbadensis]|nr:hypothetical protein BJY00DRAFT_9444 [Aspergillus carlsbadensis]